jgi:hypothetical protein
MTPHQAIADWHRRAAAAAWGHPFRAEDVLAEGVRFLETPRAQRMGEAPHFTEAEHAEMETWLPTIRLAARRPPLD